MREYGMIYSAFWTSATAQGFSDDAKMLGAYLLTCSHGTIAGVCRLSDGYVSDDLNWTIERVSKGFAELLAKGFADRCGTTKWVWIRKFLEWNKPENPNQWKAVWKVVGQIPTQCAWLPDFAALLLRLTGKKIEQEPNPSETVTTTVSKSHTHSDPHSDTHSQPNPAEIGGAKRAARSTATHLPDDFDFTEIRREVAAVELVDPEREFTKFCDHWRAASGANARKRNWDAAWRNWCRKAADYRGSGSGLKPAAPKLTFRPDPADDDPDEVARARSSHAVQ